MSTQSRNNDLCCHDPVIDECCTGMGGCFQIVVGGPLMALVIIGYVGCFLAIIFGIGYAGYEEIIHSNYDFPYAAVWFEASALLHAIIFIMMHIRPNFYYFYFITTVALSIMIILGIVIGAVHYNWHDGLMIIGYVANITVCSFNLLVVSVLACHWRSAARPTVEINDDKV